MTNTSTDHAIRSRIDSFLTELGALVRQSALEAVQEALGGSAPRRRGPGRPKGSGRRGPGRPPKAARRRAGKRVRRSAEDLAKIGARVLAQVRSKAGQRLEEIGRALKTDTAVLKKPVADLLKAKKLRTTGQKRGTMYFAGGGGGAGKARKKAKVRVPRRARRASPKRSARRAAPRIVRPAPAHKKKSARKPSRKARISSARAVVNELAMDAAAMSTALP